MNKTTIGNEKQRTKASIPIEDESEDAGSSSVQMINFKRSTLKRSNPDFTAEATATKRTRRLNHSIPELNSSLVQTNDASDKKMTSIGDLPPELIQAILKRVPTAELMKCRQISRQWNEISSRIIRRREDVVLRFCFCKGKFLQEIKYRHCEELLLDVYKSYYRCGSKSLTDLMACMSKKFPYTKFHFGDLEYFMNDEMQNFLSIWGKSILQLKVNIKDPIKSVVTLRELLFEKVTNLKKLELYFCKDEICWIFDNKMPSSIKIFDDFNKLQLPNLEVLCVSVRFCKFRGVVEDILEAACNLKIFETITDYSSNIHWGPRSVHSNRIVVEEESITSEDLAMLHSFNKLDCLKNIRFFVTEDLIAYWEKSKNAMDKLKLQSLALSLKPSLWGSEQLKHGATLLINDLFRSSKDEMKTLSIEPLGSLRGLVIPKLECLKRLDLSGFAYNETTKNVMFPTFHATFEMADAFPNVKELDVHILREHDFFPSSDPLKTMASVEVLRIYGDTSTECTEKLIKATPNVTTLLMVEDDFPRSDHPNVSINFRNISNFLPKLESFGWLICRMTYRSLLYKLDAAITGIHENLCKKLSKNFRNKKYLSLDEAASFHLQRENASILDLKALKKLDVTFFLSHGAYYDEVNKESDVDKAGFNSQSQFYETGFTKVSEFLAFDLMPHLKVRAHKRME